MKQLAARGQTVSIFTAYAAEDKAFADKLKKKMKYLVRQHKVHFLDRAAIKIGTDVEKNMKAYLNEAQIILLLLSDEFLACDEIHERDLKIAVERHTAGEIQVIPIKYSSCVYEGYAFEHLQSLPRDANVFINSYEERKKEQVLTKVVTDIGDIVKKMLA